MIQTKYCLVCQKTHDLCIMCSVESNYINTMALQCCRKCHIINNPEPSNSNWKNKWLITTKQVNYPSWIKEAIIAIFITFKKLNKYDNTSLPNELWNHIYYMMSLNNIGRKYPNHIFVNPLYDFNHSYRSFCEKCNTFHYMEDGNIMSIIEKYPDDIAKKIVFLIIHNNIYRYNSIKVYVDYVKSFIKRIKETTIILDNNLMDPTIIEFLERHSLDTNDFEFENIKKQYRDDIAIAIK